MTDDEVIAAIRKTHLRTNIGFFEDKSSAVIHWEQGWLDIGGTVYGKGPYLLVPVTCDGYPTTQRVYPPERLRRRLAKAMGL